MIPAFNEEASISAVVQSVRTSGFDVVVVDDGSSDSTAVVARVAGATLLRLPMNLGVGAALRCGFRYAVDCGYTAVIQCDADGQHIPEFLPVLVEAAERSGAHLVIGSRFGGGSELASFRGVRRVAMRYLAFVTSRVTGSRLTDVTSGFRLFRGELLGHFAREFPPYYLGDTFEATYVAGRSGYRVVEVPVVMRKRFHGRSSASTATALRMVLKVLLTTSFNLHFRLPECTDDVGS